VDNVKLLDDPYLGTYSLSDFPSLLEMKNRWFTTRAWICHERAKNVTQFHRENGFEENKDGNRFDPNLRQGMMTRYMLSHKKPIIWDDDILPGTTTSKRNGVQIYPELGGVGIWPELQTAQSRYLNPYMIDDETIDILNNYVFPYWMNRNIREKVRSRYKNALSQRLDEFFCLYFAWKTQAISHTIPDFDTLLRDGLEIIGKRIAAKERKERENVTSDSNSALNFYKGMKFAVEGVSLYIKHLLHEAQQQLENLKNGKSPETGELIDINIGKNIRRISRLENMIDTLEHVAEGPARNFRDAITLTWIFWLCLHQENMNAGLSLGRLDQVLYPYYLKDMEAVSKSKSEVDAKIQEIIKLIGAFYLKCQDHLPLVPNVGNKLFGGSSSDQALTLGGVKPDGENAVNDLTYIFLKVTEMLSLRDPNVNARYHLEKNSIEYLQRLCEVNINTTSTPSIHNDGEMIDTLIKHGFKPQDARNWGATGCVEPTSIGKHFGHTNCMMFNMVAPLEILMYNGYHPLIHPKINSLTPNFIQDNYKDFDSFYSAYKKQFRFLAGQIIEYNNHLGLVHQEIHPTPLLSALFQGPLEKGKDLTRGGAIYNSSGAALVALPDVVDSIIAIKKIVYEKQLINLEDFLNVMKRDFSAPKDKVILAEINKIPKFGSDDAITNELAKDLVSESYNFFYNHENYRGGHYFVGFWSMSNHVAFGKLSGTLPSGRLRGKPFTPGLTPSPTSTDQLLENIKTIAKINCNQTPNNIAFNVKLVPSAKDTHEDTLKHFLGYTKSYFDLGGLQMQFNVVTSKLLRDAMTHPEKYRWLMVRISGYNAYFISLNRDMQMELIERMEFKA
ncbi:MAG: formate acetyltransferase, partial [Candidatus Lokiarchaeota archaeon]|nr:formate acetyltransferase [Candidatus Lokiarchaeota archaeon]